MSDPTHLLGASRTYSGITVALALPTGASEPDPDRFFVRDGARWQLLNIRDIATRTTRALPIELRSPIFAHAYDDQLCATARWLAAIAGAARPAPPPPPADAPRPWWLDL